MERRLIRNCVATYLSRSQTTVYFRLAMSDRHVWDVPVAEWESYPLFTG